MNQRLVYLIILLAILALLFPFSALSWTPYGYGPPGGFGPPGGYPGMGGEPASVPRLSLERDADADNYYLTVRVANLDPQSVSVNALGRWLVIGTEARDEVSRENQFDEGRGYSRSLSYSTNRLSRRISLPRDANTAAMERQDAADHLRITIPRVRPEYSP